MSKKFESGAQKRQKKPFWISGTTATWLPRNLWRLLWTFIPKTWIWNFV